MFNTENMKLGSIPFVNEEDETLVFEGVDNGDLEGPAIDTSAFYQHNDEELLSVLAGVSMNSETTGDQIFDEGIITVTYQGRTLSLIRIQEKPDGKNTSAYDGTYVNYAAYVLHDSTRDTSAYQEGDIFFLKMFPQKKEMLVEGFCEALLGKIIGKMIEQEFIDPNYSDCFSPAEAVNIPDVGLALLQPFLIGAVPLFQLSDESQERKSVTTEVVNRFLFNEGYERYLNPIAGSKGFHGLSYIIMIMLLFGNYSLHSGNIMVKLSEQQADFKVIDYGAAFRNFMGTWKQVDIWQSLEEEKGLSLMWEYKKYLDYYKKIPGLFDSVLEHAGNLLELLLTKSNGKLPAFQTLIMKAVGDTYELYRAAIKRNIGESYWPIANKELLDYIYGAQFDKFEQQIIAQQKTTRADYIRRDREYPTIIKALFLPSQAVIPAGKITQSYFMHNMLEVIFSRLFTLTIRAPVPAARISSDSRYCSVRLPGNLAISRSNSYEPGGALEDGSTTTESEAMERRLSEPMLRRSTWSYFLPVRPTSTGSSTSNDINCKKKNI